MDFYPNEIATPPLALVALLGCPELHATVGEFLRAVHKPPINSLGFGDPLSAGRVFGEHARLGPWAPGCSCMFGRQVQAHWLRRFIRK